MEDYNDLENDLFEEYGNDNFQESTNEPQIEENVANTDANEEAPAREVVPVPKRIIRNPRLKFNADRLCGERGIPILTKHFENVKFKGKGHEKEDLSKLLSTLEHWSHRLFPSMKFEACLHQIEKLGKKRPVQTCLVKIRRDMPILNSDFVHDEEDEREKMQNELEPPPENAFDRLFGDSSETRQPHPAPSSAQSSGVALGTSFGGSLTEEQRKRMEHNKMLATERRKARMAAQQVSKENENGRLSPTMIEPESADNTSRMTAKPTVAQNLDQQFESLFGEKNTNKSVLDDSRNNLYESIHEDSEKKHCESISKKSEELGLDELMDLVDEDDSSNQFEDNGIPSVEEASEKALAQNLGLQFDSMFDEKDEVKSIPEHSQNIRHKPILDSEDDEDESILNSKENEYESVREDSMNNMNESIIDDSGKNLCEPDNEEKKLSESMSGAPEINHFDSFPSKDEELDLDELMDLVDASINSVEESSLKQRSLLGEKCNNFH